MQHRNEAVVELDGDQAAASLSQCDRQRSGAGAHLEDLILASYPCRCGDAIAQRGIDEEVLAEGFLQVDTMPVEQLRQLIRIGRIDHVILRNNVNALARSMSASSSRLIPRSSATSVAVSSRYAGRFGTPMRMCAWP
jgi:hypothetical protein